MLFRSLAMTITPMLCGSSFKNKGTEKMLDAVVTYLPSPTEVAQIKGIDPKNEEEVVEEGEEESE